jgi:hypothetical protein
MKMTRMEKAEKTRGPMRRTTFCRMKTDAAPNCVKRYSFLIEQRSKTQRASLQKIPNPVTESYGLLTDEGSLYAAVR